MKIHKIITVMSYLIVVARLHAQYGELSYSHPYSILSSAKTTNINVSGFLMAGSLPSASANSQPDFVIDQTDLNGSTTGAGLWSKEYRLSNDPACSSPLLLARQYGCVGVDIIETNPGNGIKYAVAAAYNGGIFFMALDNAGGVVSYRFWRIPAAGFNPQHRPTIRESAANPGIYFICGDFSGEMFAIRHDLTGATSWAKTYSGPPIWARSLIESQNGTDLVVVGRVDLVPSGLAAEAFFMTLSPTSGAVGIFNCYGNSNGDEWFTSIEYANSPTGGTGYIIGGRDHHTSPNNALYKPWMVKMDPTGNVIWSTLIQHSIAADPLEISDVIERLNTNNTPNTYEYFGVAQTPVFSPAPGTDWMTVWKLDDSGLSTFSPSEFQYPLANTLATDWSYNPTQIELIGTGSATGDGIQVFGTDQESNPLLSNHILVGSYFNGINSTPNPNPPFYFCETSGDWTRQQGSGYSVSPSLTVATLPPCTIAFYTVTAGSAVPSPLCTWQSPVTGGSNARAAATGIQQNSENSTGIPVYPNPTNKSVTLAFRNELNGPAHIDIINSLGQVEKKIDISNKNSNEVELDFESLQLNEGLYFVNVSVNADTYTTKVMYKK